MPGRHPLPSSHPLREWRERRHLTLAAVAAMVGVSGATISRLERRKVRLSAHLVARLLRASEGAVQFAAFV
jgi:transcriptional regulator with XRE-family HTH domain